MTLIPTSDTAPSVPPPSAPVTKWRGPTPRRSGARWREGAPPYILDIFDDARTCDRYTVLFGGLYFVDGTVSYLGMSGSPTHPQGFSQWGELKPHEAAAYRYRNGYYRIRWLDLPEHIREHVIARAEDCMCSDIDLPSGECIGCQARTAREEKK